MRKSYIALVIALSLAATSFEMVAMKRPYSGDGQEGRDPKRFKPLSPAEKFWQALHELEETLKVQLWQDLCLVFYQEKQQNQDAGEVAELVWGFNGMSIAQSNYSSKKRKRDSSSAESLSGDEDNGLLMVLEDSKCQPPRKRMCLQDCSVLFVPMDVAGSTSDTPSPEYQLALRAVRETAKFEEMMQKERDAANQ